MIFSYGEYLKKLEKIEKIKKIKIGFSKISPPSPPFPVCLKKIKGILQKISVHDAGPFTPLSQIRGRWHFAEINGEFASMEDDSNRVATSESE